jgi:hypothetical protein
MAPHRDRIHHRWIDLVSQGLDARRLHLVPKRTIEAVFHEPFLPPPDAGLGLAGRHLRQRRKKK